MVKLYLVRHGESLSADINPDQPLSPQGKKETQGVADLLKQSPLELDEILHSTKLRAKQTAEILGRTLAPDLILVQREGLKPNDPVEPLLSEIYTFNRNVMLVGHLPFLETLLKTLLRLREGESPVRFSGSCVVCLNGEGKNWQIEWVVSPNLFMPDPGP